MREDALRAAVRQAYEGRCGYCTVHETEAGSELEIDHFQPRAAGGGDDLDNLVYCCSACNRFKADFWPPADPFLATQRLLHPRSTDLAQHLHEESDSTLSALSETGTFHIEHLRLNRPPLIALRRARQEARDLAHSLAMARQEQARLNERIVILEQDFQQVLAQLTRLLDP